MKELSIEEKAKAYDGALEMAKNTIEVNQTIPNIVECVESLFPMLKESEDEKVKRILHSISSKISSNLRDIFTEEEFQCFDTWANVWLEKQDEQKPETIFLKFKIGDKVINGEDTYTISFIGKDCYRVKEHDCVTIPFEYQHHWKLVEQKPSWDEEDEINRDLVYNALNQVYDMVQNKNLSAWINKHIPFIQNTWKPSDEQMEALEKECIAHSNYELCRLLEQLKELREEYDKLDLNK